MYGKIFESIYDGSLADNWETMVVFQQFIILCDENGTVDMTPRAISRRTGMPLEIIEPAIEKLESPDPESRSSEEEGRRLVRLDPDRSWGWRLVNHKYYRDLAKRQDKLKADRERIRQKRATSKGASPETAKFDDKECAYCNQPAVGLDHIIPGIEKDENLVPACNLCNSSKNARSLVDFLNDPAKSDLNLKKILANPKLTKHIEYLEGKFISRKPAPDTNVADGRKKSQEVAKDRLSDTDTDTDTKDIYTSDFLTFWSQYPKKVGKGAAFTAWKKIKPPRPKLHEILKSLAAHKKSRQWNRDGGQFIPNPATWLNQRRWEDEPEEGEEWV